MARTMPKPECEIGYPISQLEKWNLFPLSHFRTWMKGQTYAVCNGEMYDHEKKEYLPSSCSPIQHGSVFYTRDVLRFLEGKEVID